jgi:hypothetical protein
MAYYDRYKKPVPVEIPIKVVYVETRDGLARVSEREQKDEGFGPRISIHEVSYGKALAFDRYAKEVRGRIG